MNLTKTHQYFISLTVATVFFLLNRNIWLNSIVSMVLIFLLCERKIQIKSVALSIGISLFVGVVDYILQYILIFYTVPNIIVITAEDLFCFLLFYIISMIMHRKQHQLNFATYSVFLLIAIALRIAFNVCNNMIVNGNINPLTAEWLPYLKTLSYFVAVIGVLYKNTTNKETN